MRGHCGHSFPLARVAGGCVMSSKLTTESHPCRSEVPMQSVPVSPPPITTTFLPFASMYCPSARFAVQQRLGVGVQKLHGEVHALQGAPLHGQVARLGGAARQDDRVGRVADVGDGGVPLGADVRVDDEVRRPRRRAMSARRCTISSLSAFMFGTPYIISPPTRSARSYTVTLCPALFSWSAAAMPAGPDPTTAHLLARARGGRRGDDPALRRTRGPRWSTR